MTAAGGHLSRVAAFTSVPDGGNPAGVWVGGVLPTPQEMQAIAAEVGYSETVFAVPAGGGTAGGTTSVAGPAWTVRYFSPVAEVPFCGHATIALGHVLGPPGAGAGDGGDDDRYTLDTVAGRVSLRVTSVEGVRVATLESVAPSHVDADPALVEATLGHLGWSAEDLDARLAPAVAHAGVHHLVLAVSSRDRLADLDYGFEGLRATMLDHDLTTVALVWSPDWTVVHARNPFPVGGVVEDPATGAAAAALGGLLRDRGLVPTPHVMTVRQGEDMGRPSTLDVQIPAHGGILVSGTSVDLPDDDD